MPLSTTAKWAPLTVGLSLWLALACPVRAQRQADVRQTAPAATLTGTALDKGAKAEPLPFATALLRRAETTDTSLVATGQTTLQGTFALPGVPAGTYRLRLLALGYQSFGQVVRVAPGQSIVALGQLKLSAATQQLTEVKVVGQRPVVQQELGKTIINVDKDLNSVGGTAVNVLQNVPSVAVDATGMVSLRGSTNLTVLVDGKPTLLTLDQIQASQIAQVEVKTNPSASSDASGAGIINIITKKNKQEGWNGQVGLVVGTHGKYVPTLNLSRHYGLATWNLNYSGNDQLLGLRTSSRQTAALGDGTSLFTTQDGTGTQRNRTHTLNLGLDYALTEEQTLGLSLNYYRQLDDVGNSQALTQQTVGLPDVLTQNSQQSSHNVVNVLDGGVSYNRTWKTHPGRKLAASAGLATVAINGTVSQLVTGGSLPAGLTQQQPTDIHEYNGQLNYTQPSADGKGTFETGFKLEAQRTVGSLTTQRPLTTSPDSGLQFDPASSFEYNLTQMVPAAYATYQRTFSAKWNAEGGLRTEGTVLRGGVPTRDIGLQRSYLNLFPSVTVARELGQAAGQSRLQLSYARRINRPNSMQQLPFQNYRDPRTYRQGNVDLLPEFSHNLELGHQFTLASGASFTTTVFARFTQQSIQLVRSIDTVATRLSNVGVVTQETYLNAGTTTNLGLELSWAQALTAWWRVSASGSLYRSQIATNAANLANRSALAGGARFTSNFTPAKGLDVQLTGNFRSTVLTAQGRQLPTGGFDLALRQRLLQDRATLTLRVSDLLNTQVRRTELATPELQTSLTSKYETRIAWLGFTWHLGTSKPSKKLENAPSTFGG